MEFCMFFWGKKKLKPKKLSEGVFADGVFSKIWDSRRPREMYIWSEHFCVFFVLFRKAHFWPKMIFLNNFYWVHGIHKYKLYFVHVCFHMVVMNLRIFNIDGNNFFPLIMREGMCSKRAGVCFFLKQTKKESKWKKKNKGGKLSLKNLVWVTLEH